MPASSDNTRILILDPSVIRDAHSHHLQALNGYISTLGRSDCTLLTATNTRSNYQKRDVINYPVFDYSIYDDFYNKRTGRLRRIFNTAYYNNLLNDISSCIRHIQSRENLSRHDHIFLPTLDWLLYRALLQVYDDIEHSPCFHLLIMYEHANWVTGGYPYNRIIDSLNNEMLAGRSMFFYTETKRHGKRLERSLEEPVHTFPFPALPFAGDNLGKSGNVVYIGALGGGRRDKGFCQLPDIILEFNASNPEMNTEFIIQAGRAEDDLSAENSLLERIANVTLLDNEIGRPAYEDNLLKCDILIFPYSNTVYQWRGSGIVNEALANAIPIVCTRGTALEEAIISGNGKSASGPGEFAAVLARMITDLGTFRKNALSARDQYMHSLYSNPLLSNIEATRNSDPVVQ